MAALHRPSLLIADEATSALDLITQSEILQLFRDLSRKFGMGILYISHDLLSVATISQRVAVMQAARSSNAAKPRTSFAARNILIRSQADSCVASDPAI